MKNVPEMISTKDSAYLKDMFNWNFVAMKKFDDYLSNVENADIAKKLDELANMHLKNCTEIVKILESGDEHDR